MLVMSPSQRHPDRGYPAFTLIEMMAVLAILVILLAAGVSRLSGPGNHPGKTDLDALAGLIEQARATAITSRSCVALALAEPGDLPARDPRCHLAIFQLDAPPDNLTLTARVVLMGRWQPMEPGIALIGGEVVGADNPLDAGRLTFTCEFPRRATVQVHAIAFDPCGGLIYPPGAAPVMLRLAGGIHQPATGAPTRRNRSATEVRLKIGRVSARPYRLDG